MSTTLIILTVVVAALIALITVNYYRMKNMKPVENSKKIITLGNKNFKLALKKEILLVDFWAPWCGPCRMVVPLVEEIAKERSDIKVVKINVDEEQELAMQFGVMSIPTLVVMKNGKIVNQATGARPKAQILAML